MSIITLTTDFGLRDNFVGVMKGVILGIAPEATIVDLAHDLPAHDTGQAAFSILTAFPFFPAETIHVAVVDPGVGSGRPILAVKAYDQAFIAPDNGLLSYMLETAPFFEARRVTNQEWYLSETSQTFHGRDIIAPVAAHLAAGEPFEEVGPVVDEPARLAPLAADMHSEYIEGRVIYVDRFGNLITNIRTDSFTIDMFPEFQVGPVTIQGLSSSYSEGKPGEFLALPGSHGYIEIARNMDVAEQWPELTVGTPILVKHRS